MIEVIFIRHGKTKGNLAGRYIGSRTDEPLCGVGVRLIQKKGEFPEVAHVISSPLLRATETAKLLFPNAQIERYDELREMDFGDFENRSAAEMEADEAYRAWVESGCTSGCPNGETFEAFVDRTCKGFRKAVRNCMKQKQSRLLVVAHGGTIMAIMGRYARPERPYFEWYVKNGAGFSAVLNETVWKKNKCFSSYDYIETPRL